MQENNPYQFYINATAAVEHGDAFDAYRILQDFDRNAQALLEQADGDADLRSDLNLLKRELRFVAFPQLSRSEAEKILSSEIASLLKEDVDLSDCLSVRLAFTPYGEIEEEQKYLKRAILNNKEMLGGMIIGDWLAEFDKKFPPLTRNKQAILDFLTREPKTKSLSLVERGILELVLEAYEDWIVAYRLNIFDVAVLEKKGKKAEVGTKVRVIDSGSVSTNPSYSTFQSAQRTLVNLPILQALSKYEQLGNQLITQERIKIKSQVEPVRPSLLYWLKYYRDELGVGHHDSVQRGQFLFRSENGKKLSAEERERVNLILKSVEENMPLQIDVSRNEIIFPRIEVPLSMPVSPAPVPALAFEPRKFVPATPAPERAFPATSAMPAPIPVPSTPVSIPEEKPVAHTSDSGALSFSSKHVFPAERDKVIKKPVTPPDTNPFHIRPVSMQDKEE